MAKHYGPEQPKIQAKVLGHSLVRLLVCLHSSLLCLLRFACFIRALRCVHSFTRLLPPDIVGNRMSLMTCTHQYHLDSTCTGMAVLWRKFQYHRDSDHITKTVTISRTQRSYHGAAANLRGMRSLFGDNVRITVVIIIIVVVVVVVVVVIVVVLSEDEARQSKCCLY